MRLAFTCSGRLLTDGPTAPTASFLTWRDHNCLHCTQIILVFRVYRRHQRERRGWPQLASCFQQRPGVPATPAGFPVFTAVCVVPHVQGHAPPVGKRLYRAAESPRAESHHRDAGQTCGMKKRNMCVPQLASYSLSFLSPSWKFHQLWHVRTVIMLNQKI